MTLFDSVLVANRGEIAVRVMRTCRKLGIRTIALYSDADSRALHAVVADEAHRIGPPPASESYLNQAAILRVARETGAQALHPGYGFLAENAAFAQACLDAGIAWIGPSPEAMRTLGDKAKAKALAERVGVPLLPGYHGEKQDPGYLAERAREMGYPVLIKASGGGGGRGMRIVESPAEFAAALEAARREAMANFGDQRVLLERYVRRPRHVEVQILGDQHGNVIHLGERECSIQRRYQKLIEESPSPAVDEALRARLGDAALKLARAANYSNAGTVEFLLDEGRNFYFLEVNARLQVEHPVTEEVTGIDLVELQLRVASGERLSLRQEDMRLNGHAIEARVIAEDPLKGFLPSAGAITEFKTYWFTGVRIDSGIQEGSVVSPYYDSLLLKIVAKYDYGDSPGLHRQGALSLLATALDESRVEGVETNMDLLLAVVQHPAFQAGDLHTGFLEEHGILESLSEVPPEVVAAVAVAATQAPPSSHGETDPWRGPSAWRQMGMDQLSSWDISGTLVEARVSRDVDSDALLVKVGDKQVRATYVGRVPGSENGVRVESDNVQVNLWVEGECVEWKGRTYRLQQADALEIDRLHGSGHGAAGLGSLTAPMPGRVVKVAVAEGDRVKANQPLIVLEAMKMEHIVDAPHEGMVRRVHVRQGEQVAGGTVLVELAEEEA